MAKDLIPNQHCKDLSLGDFIGHLVSNKIDLGISFSLDENGLKVRIDNPIILEIGNEFDISVEGETNIISKGLNIDTLYDKYRTKFNLNGRNSKQIRDDITSIEYRKKVKEQAEELKKIADIISAPSIAASTDEKLNFLNQYKLKSIKDREE